MLSVVIRFSLLFLADDRFDGLKPVVFVGQTFPIPINQGVFFDRVYDGCFSSAIRAKHQSFLPRKFLPEVCAHQFAQRFLHKNRRSVLLADLYDFPHPFPFRDDLVL